MKTYSYHTLDVLLKKQSGGADGAYGTVKHLPLKVRPTEEATVYYYSAKQNAILTKPVNSSQFCESYYDKTVIKRFHDDMFLQKEKKAISNFLQAFAKNQQESEFSWSTLHDTCVFMFDTTSLHEPDILISIKTNTREYILLERMEADMEAFEPLDEQDACDVLVASFLAVHLFISLCSSSWSPWVHRDIKPANLLYKRVKGFGRYQVKLGDFTFMTEADSVSDIAGTPYFMLVANDSSYYHFGSKWVSSNTGYHAVANVAKEKWDEGEFDTNDSMPSTGLISSNTRFAAHAEANQTAFMKRAVMINDTYAFAKSMAVLVYIYQRKFPRLDQWWTCIFDTYFISFSGLMSKTNNDQSRHEKIGDLLSDHYYDGPGKTVDVADFVACCQKHPAMMDSLNRYALVRLHRYISYYNKNPVLLPNQYKNLKVLDFVKKLKPVSTRNDKYVVALSNCLGDPTMGEVISLFNTYSQSV